VEFWGVILHLRRKLAEYLASNDSSSESDCIQQGWALVTSQGATHARHSLHGVFNGLGQNLAAWNLKGTQQLESGLVNQNGVRQRIGIAGLMIKNGKIMYQP